MTARVAIVGSGPTGCYTAQALRKALPEAEIVVFERERHLYGLVRAGVAPDHAGTKAVTRQFDRLFERERVIARTGVTIGRDLGLDAARAAFHAVVLATGLDADRRLGIPGEGLPEVVGSGAFARHANGAGGPRPALGRHLVVVGAGNVAIDVARVALKGAGAFEGAAVERATIVARGPREAAKFDAAMLRELEQVAGDRLEIRFGLTPLAIEGETHVTGLVSREATGATIRIPCDSLVTAIGHGPGPDAPPFRPWETGAPVVLAPGLFAAGWFRRGPRGTIPEARTEGQMVAAAILDSGALAGHKPGLAALSLPEPRP